VAMPKKRMLQGALLEIRDRINLNSFGVVEVATGGAGEGGGGD
jgi:hypothetical protein